MADRVERLTNLLALLLETRRPLSLTDITHELVGQYPDGEAARRGAFERDKSALRDIGVPIDSEIVAGGDNPGQTVYWIDRSRYEMQGLQLDDDERRALQIAMAATRPNSASGQEALWKLGAGTHGGVAAVTAVVPDDPALPVLRDAVTERQPVRFRYRDVDRLVDPWGLLLRDGFWYLIGHDHGRGERRTYRIDRIDGEITVDAASTFERPSDFDPRDAFPDDPKLIGADDRHPDAIVRFAQPVAAAVVRELGADRVVAEHDDGSVDLAVPCANPVAFRSWVIGYLDQATVLTPDEVRDDLIAWLTATTQAAAGTVTRE